MNTRFSSALHLQNLLKLGLDVHQRQRRQRATRGSVQPPHPQPHASAVDREAARRAQLAEERAEAVEAAVK